MEIEEALDIVVAQIGNTRFRELCDESHPDHEYWRALVIAKADRSAPPPQPLRPPSWHVQATNLAGTIVRVVVQAAAGGEIVTPEETAQERMKICMECDRRLPDDRCGECGCWLPAAVKVAAKPCPLDKWPPLGG